MVLGGVWAAVPQPAGPQLHTGHQVEWDQARQRLGPFTSNNAVHCIQLQRTRQLLHGLQGSVPDGVYLPQIVRDNEASYYSLPFISPEGTLKERLSTRPGGLSQLEWRALAKCALGLLRLEKLGARFSAPSVDDFLLFRNQHSGAVRFMYISYHKCQLVGGPHWDGIWMPVELLGECFDDQYATFCLNLDGLRDNSQSLDTVCSLGQVLYLGLTGRNVAGDTPAERRAWVQQVRSGRPVIVGGLDDGMVSDLLQMMLQPIGRASPGSLLNHVAVNLDDPRLPGKIMDGAGEVLQEKQVNDAQRSVQKHLRSGMRSVGRKHVHSKNNIAREQLGAPLTDLLDFQDPDLARKGSRYSKAHGVLWDLSDPAEQCNAIRNLAHHGSKITAECCSAYCAALPGGANESDVHEAVTRAIVPRLVRKVLTVPRDADGELPLVFAPEFVAQYASDLQKAARQTPGLHLFKTQLNQLLKVPEHSLTCCAWYTELDQSPACTRGELLQQLPALVELNMAFDNSASMAAAPAADAAFVQLAPGILQLNGAPALSSTGLGYICPALEQLSSLELQQAFLCSSQTFVSGVEQLLSLPVLEVGLSFAVRMADTLLVAAAAHRLSGAKVFQLITAQVQLCLMSGIRPGLPGSAGQAATPLCYALDLMHAYLPGLERPAFLTAEEFDNLCSHLVWSTHHSAGASGVMELSVPCVGAGWAQLSWRVCSALHHHDKLQALSLLQQLHWRMLDFWLPVADVGKIRKEAARQAAINCSYVHRSAVLLTQSLALLPLAQPAGAPLLRCQAVGPMLPAEGSWPSCCMSYQEDIVGALSEVAELMVGIAKCRSVLLDGRVHYYTAAELVARDQGLPLPPPRPLPTPGSPSHQTVQASPPPAAAAPHCTAAATTIKRRRSSNDAGEPDASRAAAAAPVKSPVKPEPGKKKGKGLRHAAKYKSD